ncbi:MULTISPECIES: Dps family protein [unclassified Paenibacillus]|uniref:Dps family protein n=1 Tax=unclassified Paenibacillus TaxID=185978 RepID=UPI001AE21704|nr:MULTISPECIES: Dps family protein [unclassified Paenibacillus]MBP1153431.1 starvation-inducible DNA-binding protein [Paenibacillus sp. PvP091]MBP1171186.1 starvation-inducible DNA-binding protein [Paenibacillus sp. PvR098]MBP2442214.1 starvation-inducible DNA-binding protein [Paenibacillus sp. PvP052]
MQLTLHETLNRQIANWSVLFVKLHNYHWYVKGQQFFTLHAKFEELYTEAAAHVDVLAERLLALGGQPVATMKGYLAQASVGDATGQETAEQMVRSIVDDFEIVVGELKTGMKLAESEKDETTGDLLLGIHASLEKHVWMLNSFLGK